LKEGLLLGMKTLEKIEIVVINENIINNLDFDCGDEDLNEFIREDALKHLYEDLAVTYLFILDGVVLGFVSISSASIKISKKHKKEMKFQYPEFPSVRIARLAIDKRYAGKGIGTHLIKWISGKSEDMGRDIGIRFISLDAYEKSINFYKKIGFHVYDSKKRNVPMYFDLKKIKKEK